MANDLIRPINLPPRSNPSASEVVPSDNGVEVAKITLTQLVNAARPFATQGQAEAGSSATRSMSPLTTKQSIAAEVGVTLASASQGALADSSVQPGDLSTVAYSGDFDDLTNVPPGLADAVSYAPQSLSPTEQAQARENLTLDYFINPRMLGAFNAANFSAACASGAAVQVSAGDTSVTLTTSQQVVDVLGALGRLQVMGRELTINLPAGQFNIPAAVVAVLKSGRVRLVGAAPVNTTLNAAVIGNTAIASVTGTANAWEVAGNVSSAAGISPGDVIIPKLVAPGVQAPGSYTPSRPVFGELRMGYFHLGQLTSSGTLCTFISPSTVLSDYLAGGDFLLCRGQSARIAGGGINDGANQATLISGTAFATNISGTDALGDLGWRYLRAVTGSVSASGTTATATTSVFDNRVDPGDIIFFQGKGARQVVSVDSGTQLTLNDAITITPSSAWALRKPGELHEGAWVISAVAGNQVTWTNTNRTRARPPQNLIASGNVTVLKTVLKFSGTSGIVVDGDLTLENIAIVGSGGGATVGIDARGQNSEGAAIIRKVGDLAVIGFGYNVRGHAGSVFLTPGICITGAVTRGSDMAAGAMADFDSARILGNAGFGHFGGPGSTTRFSNGLAGGNGVAGVRIENGAFYADYAYFVGNSSEGFIMNGSGQPHLDGATAVGNGARGIHLLHSGGYGVAQLMMSLCNRSDGIRVLGGSWSPHRGGQVIGNGGAGFNFVGTSARANDCGAGWNVGAGLLGDEPGARISAKNFIHVDNGAGAITATGGGEVLIEGHGGNGTISPMPTTTTDGQSIVRS